MCNAWTRKLGILGYFNPYNDLSEENLQVDIPTDLIPPSYILSLLKSQEDSGTIILRLEKTKILGETPTKYWELDKIYCKLKIINPDLTIKVQDFKYTNWEIEKYKMHIKQLLNLKLI